MEGNKEANNAQDKMVKDLLTMLLDIMKGVHDKAPARKKEDKQEHAENCQKCLHGPKTGVHGEHTLVARED
eukprot:3212878-Heterocapsa_arctica.AAC.1